MSEFVKVVDGVELPLDEDGFLQEPDLWNENVAVAFAEDEGVAEVTDEHWKVINYLSCSRAARPRVRASWPACRSPRAASSREVRPGGRSQPAGPSVRAPGDRGAFARVRR